MPEVVGPVEEEPIEVFGHKVESHFHAELLAKVVEVVIEEEENFGDAGLELTVKNYFHSIEEKFIVKGVWNGSVVFLDGLEEFIDELEGNGNSLGVVDVGSVEKEDNHHI